MTPEEVLVELDRYKETLQKIEDQVRSGSMWQIMKIIEEFHKDDVSVSKI